jgi:hypothetical protein
MTEPTGQRYYGKYAGTVLNNVDPEFRGRIQVNVPDVLGYVPTSWAEPCLPLAGPTGTPMGTYFVPQIGAGVWMEFEQGDVNRPIWVGCRIGSRADVPDNAQMIVPPIMGITLQTQLKNAIVISDLPPTPATGGIVLKSATGAMIVVNDSGIYISNGKGAIITLVGPAVTINNGALVVV